MGRGKRRLYQPFVFAAETLEPRVLLSKTVYVDAASPAATPDGLSWSTAYPDLQQGLSRVVSGDTLLIAGGTYKPTSGTDRDITFNLVSGVEMYGGYAGNARPQSPGFRDELDTPTILSGDIGVLGDNSDNTKRIVTAGNADSATLVDGVQIVDGNGDAEVGSAIFVRPTSATDDGGFPLFRNCTVADNTGQYFGAVFCLTDPKNPYGPRFYNCTFRNNTSGQAGGAINVHGGNATVSGCTFIGNSAGAGGAIFASPGSLTLTSSTFIRNTATGSGGAVDDDSATPVVGCVFEGNSAPAGGGIEFDQGFNDSKVAFSLVNCQFIGNRATTNGAGVLIPRPYAGAAPTCSIVNCTFVDNYLDTSGSGVYSTADDANAGVALTFVNDIIWSAKPEAPPVDKYTPLPTFSHSDTYSPTSGAGNISANPQLVKMPSPGADGTWGTIDDDYGNLQLQMTSPAIDAGNNAAVPAGVTTDAAGNPRFVDTAGVPDTGNGSAPIVDLGAAEVQIPKVAAIHVTSGGSTVSSGQATPINLGNAKIGDTPTLINFTISNTGLGALTVYSLTVPAGVEIISSSAFSIAPSASDTLQLELNTASAITVNGDVSFVTDDPAHASFKIPVSGKVTAQTVTPQPAIVVTSGGTAIISSQASAIDLGTVQQDQAASAVNISIANSGNAPLTISGLQAPAGVSIIGKPSAPIAPGSSATLQLALDSTTPAQISGNIAFNTNDPAHAVFQFPVGGSVTPKSMISISNDGQPVFSGQSSPIDLGSVTQGTPAPAVHFTIANSGNVALTITNVQPPAGVTVVEAPATIAAGASNDLVLQLDTSVVETIGSVVSFHTSDPGLPNVQLPVSGTVLAQAITPTPGLSVVSVIPALPAIVIGGDKHAKGTAAVTLRNTSSSALSTPITIRISASADGTDNGAFVLGTLSRTLKLKPQASKSLRVKIIVPAVAQDGTFLIVADVSGASPAVGASNGHSGNAVQILHPVVNLIGPGELPAKAAPAGRSVPLQFTLTNTGNVAAVGKVTVHVQITTSDSQTVLSDIDFTTSINLKPQRGKPLKFKLKPTSLVAGNHRVSFAVSGQGALGAMNVNDGQILATLTLTLS